MKIPKDIMLKCAALLAVSITTNARDESLRGANSPLSKTAIIDDAAIKGHPGVIVVASSGRNEFDHWKDYELEPMEDPNPSTGGGSLDDTFDEDTTVAYDPCYNRYCCYRVRKALNNNDGYCQPWGNQGGDLCTDEPALPACDGASNGYLPITCDEDCVKILCHNESKCKGYTWKKAIISFPTFSLGQGKLKSTISSVYGENNGYKCIVKGYQILVRDYTPHWVCKYDGRQEGWEERERQESQKEETK